MKADIPMSEIMGRMTMEVTLTGMRVAKFRLWLGMRILRLAVRVIGCGVEIKEPADSAP